MTVKKEGFYINNTILGNNTSNSKVKELAIHSQVEQNFVMIYNENFELDYSCVL